MKKESLRENVIRIKIKEIAEGISLVKEHLPPTVQEFRKLGIIKDGIYNRIEFAIEDVFDICAIINTDLALGVPSEDEDILEHLVEAGVITPLMLQKIQGMRGIRNIVVHRYGTIDDPLAFQLLTENIDDFSQFSTEIEKFLKQYH